MKYFSFATQAPAVLKNQLNHYLGIYFILVITTDSVFKFKTYV